MKKVRAILWAIWFKIKNLFQNNESLVNFKSSMENDFGYMGSFKRPFSNAILYEYDPEGKTIREVIMLKGKDGAKRGFITKGTTVVWANNIRAAKKKLNRKGLEC